MDSPTGVNMMHRALQVALLAVAASGRVVKLENHIDFAGAIQDPPACIYTPDSPPTGLPAIMYPLYYDLPKYDNVTGVCTDEYLKGLSKGCASILAVVNPGSGPAPVGSKGYNGYQACTRMMDKNNVRMIGYVKTKVAHVLPSGIWKYTNVRNMADIQRDIDSWYDHFSDIKNFNGIFVDETSNYYEIVHNAFHVNNTRVYQEIITYIKTKWKGSLVILNPGSFTSTKLLEPAPGFPEPADISIPLEDYAFHWKPTNDNCTLVQWSPDMGNFGIGPWCKYVPVWDHVEKFKDGVSAHKYIAAAFLHSNSWGLQFAIDAARRASLWNFTYLYVTDLKLANNPWRYTPSYWESYLYFLEDYGNTPTVGAPVNIPPVPLHPGEPGFVPMPWDPETPKVPKKVYNNGYKAFNCPYLWKENSHPNFADMFDCKKYYACYGDDQFKLTDCEANMNFDAILGYCRSESEIPCVQDTVTAKTPFVCPVNWKDNSNPNFVDPNNCQLFYTCSDSGVVHNICEGGWHFSPVSRFCVSADESPCEENHKALVFESEMMAEVASVPIEMISTFTCPQNWQDDKNKFYADANNCTMFYTCGATIEHAACNNGQRFDTVTRYCAPSSKVPCIEASKDSNTNIVPVPVNKFTCPSNWEADSNKFYPDVNNCTMFYICGATIEHTACNNGQRFDTMTRYCVPSSKVPCIEDSSTNIVPVPVNKFTCPFNWEADSNKFYSDIYNCTMFYTCGAKIEHSSCNNGQRFDPTNRYCGAAATVPCVQAKGDLPLVSVTTKFTCPYNWKQLSNHYYADIYDCHKFYTCGNDDQSNSCVDGQRFDPIVRFCVAANLIPCVVAVVPISSTTTTVTPAPTTVTPAPTTVTPAPTTVTPAPEHVPAAFTCPSNWESQSNKFYVNFYNCNHFYDCGSALITQACNGNQRFDPVNRYCVAADQVPCYQAI